MNLNERKISRLHTSMKQGPFLLFGQHISVRMLFQKLLIHRPRSSSRPHAFTTVLWSDFLDRNVQISLFPIEKNGSPKNLQNNLTPLCADFQIGDHSHRTSYFRIDPESSQSFCLQLAFTQTIHNEASKWHESAIKITVFEKKHLWGLFSRH